jgi:hypothetical protein
MLQQDVEAHRVSAALPCACHCGHIPRTADGFIGVDTSRATVCVLEVTRLLTDS